MQPNSNPPASTKQALIVEDDPEIRAMVQKYLGRLGMATTEARTGREALGWLSANRPALILLDLMLPEHSGFEICGFVRSTPGLSDVPVLIMSARSLPEDRARAEEVGADGYIVKPFTMMDFNRSVMEAIMHRR